MFGLLRYLLAIGVAVSHAGLLVNKFSIGSFCVVVFYILAGYTMTLLWSYRFKIVANIWNYCFERLTRLYPQYIFFMSLTLILAMSGIIKTDLIFPSEIKYYFWNLFIIPLNFYMYDDALKNFTILPASWSLGLEGIFYIIFPILFFYRKRIFIFIFISLIIFILAVFGGINTELWGYRLLPGILFVFLCGMLIFEVKQASYGNVKLNQWLLIIYFTMFYLLLLVYFIELDYKYNREVISGFLFGIPAVLILSKLKRKSLDDFFGNLSYGVFLSHFIVIWTYQSLPFGLPSIIYFPLLVIICTIMSFIGYNYIEKPFRELNWIKKINMR